MSKKEIIEYIIGKAEIADRPAKTIEKIKDAYMKKALDTLERHFQIVEMSSHKQEDARSSIAVASGIII